MEHQKHPLLSGGDRHGCPLQLEKHRSRQTAWLWKRALEWFPPVPKRLPAFAAFSPAQGCSSFGQPTSTRTALLGQPIGPAQSPHEPTSCLWEDSGGGERHTVPDQGTRLGTWSERLSCQASCSKEHRTPKGGEACQRPLFSLQKGSCSRAAPRVDIQAPALEPDSSWGPISF